MYTAIGDDYAEVASRITDNEAFIGRLVKKYAQDENYNKLVKAVQYKDYDEAFEAAHAIKGLASNLGFGKLYEASYELTEKLRAKDYEDIEGFLSRTEEAQKEVLEAISGLE